MYKLLGIPFNVITWALLAVSVGFAWAYYRQIQTILDSTNEGDNYIFAKSTRTGWLVSAILSTVALAGLTLSVMFYTVQFRDMTAISASLFFFEWALITAATVVYWITSELEGVKKSYRVVGAITSTVALGLFTLYYIIEIYPFFEKYQKDMKKLRTMKAKQSKKSVKKTKK